LHSRELERLYDEMGDTPPRFDLRQNDAAWGTQGAHTLARHGEDVPLRRADAPPGSPTVEGRIYGDRPWDGTQNYSYRWLDHTTMNDTVNQYVQDNWDTIRSDLLTEGRHHGWVDTGRAVGEGFYNSGMWGAGPRNAVASQTSFAEVTIVPGNPWDPRSVFVLRAFPSGRAPGV
jgi:hypothetical protein